VNQFVPTGFDVLNHQSSHVVEPEGIEWWDCLMIFAMFSDLATPAFKVNLVELDTFVEPSFSVDTNCMFEPSFYEPLLSNARMLDGDGVHRLLALLQLSEGVVTSTCDLMRLGFFKCGSILNLFPSISEDVAVSQGNSSHEGRSKTAICGSFLALFKGASLHLDLLKSWPAELVSLGLQRPSNSSFRFNPMAVHCGTKQGGCLLIECVNPYSFSVELCSHCHCSEEFNVAVVTVSGNTDLMFFGDNLSLAAEIDVSLQENRSVQAMCQWLGIHCKSKHLELCPEQIILSSSNDLGLNQDSVPAVEQEVARLKPEQVSLREDFDCSEGSLVSECEHDLSHVCESSDEFNFT